MYCSHKTATDHVVRKDKNGAVWKCSACGSESFWTNKHSLYGNTECFKCEVAKIDWVACSNECAIKLGGKAI